MSTALLAITGVGPATAQLLVESGFASVESVADAKPAALAKVPGVGSVRAAKLRTAARHLLADAETAEAPARDERSRREERARRLRKKAKRLRKQAAQLAKKAESTTSKKKRKERRREAARLEAAAKKARRKAKKLLAE